MVTKRANASNTVSSRSNQVYGSGAAVLIDENGGRDDLVVAKNAALKTSPGGGVYIEVNRQYEDEDDQEFHSREQRSGYYNQRVSLSCKLRAYDKIL